MTQSSGSKSENAVEGFSLLEMLVVLVVLGLSLAVASSVLKSHRSPSLSSIGGQILALLSEARLKAITRTTTTAVEINLEEKTFKLLGDNRTLLLPEAFEMVATVGRETIRNGSTGAIIFSPDSTSTGGEITVKDRSGRSIHLVTNWLTGLSKRQANDE